MSGLNPGQEAGVKSIHAFLASPDEQFMTIQGPGGTGKTYMVKHAVRTFEEFFKTRKLLGLDMKMPAIAFTATINKAAEAFSHALGGEPVQTIHSFLRLVMNEDPNNPSKDILVDSDETQIIRDTVIFIDEASYVDDELKAFIDRKLGHNAKVIFMGDPAQLKNAGALTMPAFDEKNGYRTVELTKIERYGEDTPIFELGLELRKRILAGDYRVPKAPIDGKHIVWLPRGEFDRLMLKDMQSEDWTYSTSKFLAYRNKRVQQYNKGMNEHLTGSRIFQPGDYAVNNHYVSGRKGGGIGTDRMVYIDSVTPGKEHDEPGYHIGINGKADAIYFMPENHHRIDVIIKRLEKARLSAIADGLDVTALEYAQKIRHVKSTWVDFRPVYAQTIYKCQGSTFKRVYIDLADIGFCMNKELIMRQLYVACSRAQKQLFLTGDLY